MANDFYKCAKDFDVLRYNVTNGKNYIDAERPPAEALLAPWVKIKFLFTGNYITVGNDSAPQVDNTACIKDFELGFSETLRARVSVVDQRGGSFSTFMQSILIDSTTVSPENERMVEIFFGWTNTNCGSKQGVEKSTSYYGIIDHSVCSIDSGQAVFQIEIIGLFDRSNDYRHPPIYGDNATEMFFTDAVTKLLTEGCAPRCSSVEFVTVTKDGDVPLEFGGSDLGKENKADPKKGPKGIWRANNLDKLNTLQQWCSQVVTKNEKGVIPKSDCSRKGEVFKIMEDPKLGPKQKVDNLPMIGTYIVGGGNSSPVISFNPSFKFQFTTSASAGGVAGTASVTSSQDGSKNPGHVDVGLGRDFNKCSGAEVSNTIMENFHNTYGKLGEQKTQVAADKQILAYSNMTNTETISADLVIIGDPSIDFQKVVNKYIGVIVINPFYLTPKRNIRSERRNGYLRGAGIEWLVDPPCNDVVSNKNWLVQGFNHQITGGKYITTLQLFLAAPGVHLPITAALGGSGWRPNGNPLEGRGPSFGR